MIKFENVDMYGFDAAIRGMRNPMNSWDKSDSRYEPHCETCPTCGGECFKVGKDDLALMRMLAFAGDDHGKFARFINVTVDITAPLYLWSEFDTYKVGTVANSCSKMHKLMDKEFTLEDFSHEQLSTGKHSNTELLISIIACLNVARELFLEMNDKKYWWQAIQLLPNSYNQRRTVQLNYQVLNRIYHARKNHKLDEWREFCDWIESLPYFIELFYGE